MFGIRFGPGGVDCRAPYSRSLGLTLVLRTSVKGGFRRRAAASETHLNVRPVEHASATARGRLFNVFDLVNKPEAEGRSGRQGRMADYLGRLDFVTLDELGHLPFAQSGGQLLFHQKSWIPGSAGQDGV